MGIINQLITGGHYLVYTGLDDRFRSDSDDHCFRSFRGTVENVWDPVSLPCLSMGNNILHTWETTCAFYCKKLILETIYSKTHVYVYIHIHIYIFGWTKSCFPCICPQIKLTVYTLISFAGTASGEEPPACAKSSSGSWLQSIQSKDGVPSKHVLHHHYPNSI